MNPATQPNRNAQPFKILSLDDGDVGGLSSLLILENIMENIQIMEDLPDTPKPCDIFDLIGGTGTGGIIAIMLGRLGMTIGDCIETYKKISGEAFTPKNRKLATRLARRMFRLKKRISTANLESALKKAIREHCSLDKCVQEREKGKPTVDICKHENEKFRHQQCVKTVVLATTKANADARPILFKTYRATASLSECKIWEVGRATSAMVDLFKPIMLGRENEEFINSSFGHSNPCKILIEEATELLAGQQEMLILSIGTGLGDVVEMGNDKKSLTNVLKIIATSSKRVADELKRRYYSQPERYHRFSIANGEKAIAASDLVERSKVAAHTKNYLNEKQQEIRSFTNILVNGFPLVSEQPERPDGPVPAYHIPFNENPNFVGRQDILFKLDDKLFTRAGFQQVALVGLGGMGKTQVALRFAYTVKAQYTDYSVFWLTAASIDGFRNSCKDLTIALNIQTSDGEDPCILVKNYLAANTCGKWLLILDNVDDPGLLDATDRESRISTFLPQSKEGRVLFTTRSKKVSWQTVGRDEIELKEMSPEDLTTILMRSVKDLNDESHIRDEHSINELLSELCHLPLAVAQATDYIAVNQISIARYLKLLRKSKEGKIELLEHGHVDDVHLDNSQSAVARTWLITFRQIQETSSDAVNLLRFIAKIEAKAIPQTMLPDYDEKSTLEAIGVLLSYGFLRRRKTPEILDMHSLVHLITQKWCEDPRDEEKHMLTVVDHMASIFPSDEWENRFLWRQYLPHALRVVKNEKASGESMTELEFKVGQCLQTDGNNRNAVKLLEHVVEVEGEALAADHPSRLASQHELAGAYQANGQIGKAVSMLEHVVEVEGEALAADHPSRLASQRALAEAYQANGQIGKAVSMLEHVVEVQGEALAADHLSRLASQHALAGAYKANGQIGKAVSMLEHVVEVQGEALAADHLSRLASQHALAGAYQDDGQIGKAVSMLEHVVKTKEKALAADHPSRLASQHALAGAYQANGQIGKAVSMLEHVVEVQGEALAADHPSRLASQHALAGAYQANGQIGKAVSMLEHVVKTKEEALAADHPSRLASQHALAGAYQDDGQIGKAVLMLEHVVEVQGEALAADHPSRLASQHALAGAYQDDGQIGKAVSMLEHVVKTKEEALAADHPSRLASQHALAGAYQDDGQIGKAVSMLEHVVKTREGALAADHPSRLASQHALAGAYKANGQIGKAVSMLEHVVEVQGEALAADHPSRLASQHALAGAYQDDGQIGKAVLMLEHVVEVQGEALAADHPSRLASQHALAGAYQDDGQIGKAVSMLEHVVKTKEEALAADHPSRLASQHALAGAYQANGQIGKAVSMLEHVVKTKEEALAADHPSRLASQHALAGAYQDDGQIGKAVSMLEHVVEVEREALAADHPSRLASQHALAGAYQDDGQIGKAVSMLEHVVKTREGALAADHPSRLASQHALAEAYKANGNPQAAIELLKNVVELDKISSTRNPKHRLQAQRLLEKWLKRQPDSQDVLS